MSKYTISELAKKVGITTRTAQLWSDRGIIYADTATEFRGPGVYRLFSHYEVTIACVIGVLVEQKVAIGMLFKVSEALRNIDIGNADTVFLRLRKGNVYVDTCPNVKGIEDGLTTIIQLKYAFRNLQ